VDAEGRDYAENSGGRARAYALGGIRTSRRAFVCGIVALVSSVFGMAPFSWAEEEVEAGLEIQHVTELNSPDWIFGTRDGVNVFGEYIRNGKTSAEDRQRTDVGIGEVIELAVYGRKLGFVGLDEDIQWEIVEGDAYFVTADSVDDTSKTTWKGVSEIQLKILVNGDNAPNQTVRVKVKTKPIVPDSNPVTRRGFTAYATLDFNRKRPIGHATSFHAIGQWKNGIWNGTADLSAINSAGVLIGAWTILNVFPLPTSVNFGGPVEGGVKVLELDGNPDGIGEFAGERIPVVCEPYSNLYKQLSLKHKPNRRYVGIDESGFFIDNIGYYSTLPTIIKADSEFYLAPDHCWEWQCNWYYIDGIYAAQYNTAPTDSFANGEFVISYNERQKFKVFGHGSNQWNVKLEKFGSSVRRSNTGNTFTQTRVHGWMPWGETDPNSAPPCIEDDVSGPYPYCPYLYVPLEPAK
jgi:hypothetical protein